MPNSNVLPGSGRYLGRGEDVSSLGPPREGYQWQQRSFGSQYSLPIYEQVRVEGQGTSSGASPLSTTPSTPYPSIPNFGLPDIQQITAALNQMQQQAFQQAERNRIPGQQGLEGQSSSDIESLLSPGEYFPGTSRESAEIAGLRGLPGEAGASDSTWVRRTREEQLREMGLGEQFLSAALARHPIGPQFDPSGLAAYLAQLPEHQAQLLTQQQQFAAQQEQQRALALAQMENAYRIAQLGALRAGGHLTGGYGPHYGSTGIPTGPTTTSSGPRPIPVPPVPAGEGWGSTWSIPQAAIPENWASLTPAQQEAYAGMIGANPYFGLPLDINPYSDEYTGQGGGGPAIGQPPVAEPALPTLGMSQEDLAYLYA